MTIASGFVIFVTPVGTVFWTGLQSVFTFPIRGTKPLGLKSLLNSTFVGTLKPAPPADELLAV